MNLGLAKLLLFVAVTCMRLLMRLPRAYYMAPKGRWLHRNTHIYIELIAIVGNCHMLMMMLVLRWMRVCEVSFQFEFKLHRILQLPSR